MNRSSVTTSGIENERPEREAMTGVVAGRFNGSGARYRENGRGEDLVVPKARFESYYGRPVLKTPVWSSPDIPGYLFLGGLAGGSSLLAAGAQLTARGSLARGSKFAAAAAAGLSLAALVHDLGRPARFLNMLRVFKPTSPMSVGSFLLAAYVPAALVSAACEASGKHGAFGAAGTAAGGLLGPAVAAYTAALISNTAVPAWHEGHREMPFLFVSSAASAAGGMGLLTAKGAENGPARNIALSGAVGEIALKRLMELRMGEEAASPYHSGKAGQLLKMSEALTGAGALGALTFSRRNRLVAGVSGVCLVLGSALTRFGIFNAGRQSALDPGATVLPQRRRLEAQQSRDG